MHLWNLLPNRGPYMEHSIEEQAMYAGMIDNPPRLVDGLLHLDADGGGWGIRVNDGWLAASNHQASTMETSG
jgi:hypothetical protein